MRKILAFLVPALLLSACEMPFSLEGNSSPKLYVQLVPGGTQTALKVRYAAPAYGSEKDRYTLQGLSAHVLVNGREVALEASETGGLLIPASSFSEGDKVEVNVTADGLPEAHGSTVIPLRPDVVAVTQETIQVDTAEMTRVTVRFGHAIEDDEHYGIQIMKRSMLTIQTPQGPLEDEKISWITPGRLASMTDLGSVDLDDYAQVNYEDGIVSTGYGHPMTFMGASQFDGDKYVFYLDSYDASGWETWIDPDEMPDMGQNWGDLTLPGKPEVPEFPMEVENSYKIFFYRLSDELFYYSKAQYLSNFDFLSNLGLTPANFTYSNVSGGLGIVGGISFYESDWL